MVDFLIIGSGIAGICFAETALQNNKSILVADDASQNSSNIAAGIYNPVILKRFTAVWNASAQIDYLNSFYPQIEERLNSKIDFKLSVYRKLFSIEEQNNWFVAADKPNLSPFLSQDIANINFEGINSPFGFGQVLDTGFVNTKLLLKEYQKFLRNNQMYLNTTFQYSNIQFQPDHIQYQDIQAKHIIFAEGFGLHANPYFNYLSLDGTKGEILIIKAPNLKIDCIVNASVYIVPMGSNLYKVGATYNWDDKTNDTTTDGKKELLDKISQLLDCDFEVIEHLAGIRPTVKDRRPLVGTHHIHKNMHILNGLGTRGVMLGPTLANNLYQNIINNIPLDDYINIVRYNNLL